jgi:CRISPR-associated protein Csh2
MAQEFNKRVYGFAIIKSINSNYNADFSGQPRKLPNGKIYATDKALKYSIRNYWKDALDEKVFYFKSLTDDMSPRTLDETYEMHFGKMKNKKGPQLRKEILENILTVLDVKLFGGTYAGATNISIHGTCQITHGLNRFPEDVILL